MIRFEQMFYWQSHGSAVARLQWGDHASDPVRVELTDRTSSEVLLAQLDGVGVTMPTPFGELHVRLDRETQAFVLSFGDQPLRAGAPGPLGSTTFAAANQGATAARTAPKKSNTLLIVCLAVIGVVVLGIVGMVAATMTLRAKVNSSLSQVSTTIAAGEPLSTAEIYQQANNLTTLRSSV